MSGRLKTVKILAVCEGAAALIAVLIPHLGFEVCEAPMHCYYTYMAEIGTAAIIVAAAAVTILSKGVEAPRMLGVVTAVCGAFVILYPTSLIGVCGSPKMACHYGLLPVWNILGGIIILLSAAVFFMAKEVKD